MFMVTIKEGSVRAIKIHHKGTLVHTMFESIVKRYNSPVAFVEKLEDLQQFDVDTTAIEILEG